jgi:hypothetical protein
MFQSFEPSLPVSLIPVPVLFERGAEQYTKPHQPKPRTIVNLDMMKEEEYVVNLVTMEEEEYIVNLVTMKEEEYIMFESTYFEG